MWENRISGRLCQPIRDKLWFWKLCVNQCQVDCRSMPPVGQLRVKFFKKCARRSASSGNLCEISLTVLVHAGVGESDWVVDSAAGYRHVSAITIIVHSVHRRLGCCYQVYFIKDWTGEVSCQPWIWNKCIDINRAEHDHELLKQNIAEHCVVFVYTVQRTVSGHCELALCAEFIVQWLAHWAGYSETRVRFTIFPISTLDYWRWGRVAVWL